MATEFGSSPLGSNLQDPLQTRWPFSGFLLGSQMDLLPHTLSLSFCCSCCFPATCVCSSMLPPAVSHAVLRWAPGAPREAYQAKEHFSTSLPSERATCTAQREAAGLTLSSHLVSLHSASLGCIDPSLNPCKSVCRLSMVRKHHSTWGSKGQD